MVGIYSRRSRIRQRYIAGVREIYQVQWNPTSDQDRIWNTFLQGYMGPSQDPRRLIQVLMMSDAEIAPTYKARILACLLAPRQEWTVFGWHTIATKYPLPACSFLEVERFSIGMREFLFKLLRYNLEVTQGHSKPRDSYRRTANRLILRILTSSDRRFHEEFFALYDFGLQGHTPDDPILQIMTSLISEGWKKAADQWLQGMVVSETHSHKFHPANAAKFPFTVRYVNLLKASILAGVLPYQVELLQDQMKFVSGGLIIDLLSTLGPDALLIAIGLLKQLDCQELRAQLVMSFSGRKGFKLETEKAIDVLEALISEFASSRSSLFGVLSGFRYRLEPAFEKKRLEYLERKDREKAVLGNMRHI